MQPTHRPARPPRWRLPIRESLRSEDQEVGGGRQETLETHTKSLSDTGKGNRREFGARGQKRYPGHGRRTRSEACSLMFIVRSQRASVKPTCVGKAVSVARSGPPQPRAIRLVPPGHETGERNGPD